MNNNSAIIALVVLLLIVGGFLYFANRGDDNGIIGGGNGGATTTEDDNGAGDTDEAATTTENTNGGDMLVGAALSAKTVLAARLGVSPADVEVSEVTPTEWPDGCLGLPKQGEFCTQALVPGYRVTLNAEGKTYVYRTNEFGTKVRLEQ